MGNKIHKTICVALLLFTITSSFIKAKELWLNIFIHGIISIVPVLSLNTISLIKKDAIENSLYEAYVTNARNNTFFNKNQPKQALGLQKIDLQRTDAQDGSPAIAKLFDLQYSWLNPKDNLTNRYYTFGWSGFMTPKKMYKDAKNLYTELLQEIAQLKSQGITPKTRLIGFSHGGSVCLKLAEVIQKEHLKRTFAIDELLLLGMPVMKNKDFLVRDPLFKKIYHFYSGADRVQVLDFSQKNNLFSRRRFNARKKFRLPDNLLQVRLELFRDLKLKSGWGWSKKYSHNFDNPTKSFARHSSRMRKCSPGHCEWWFFGWTSKYYRHDFALTPLPMASVIPTIMDVIQNGAITPDKSKKFGNQITLQVRPFEHHLYLRNKTEKKSFPFLSKEKLELLKNTATRFPFEKISLDCCQVEVNKALEKAKDKVALYQMRQKNMKNRAKKK